MIADAIAVETLFNSIVNHGKNSILGGTVFEKPYPHLIFENFFADDVYRRLISLWPDLDQYVDLNGARTRKQYTLWDRQVEAGDPERTPALAHGLGRGVRAGDRSGAARALAQRAQDPPEGERRALAGADVSAARPLRRLRRLCDQAASRHAPQGADDDDLHARGREPARTRHHSLQDLGDGRLRVEDLRPGQGKDHRVPAQHGLRLRGHPPRAQPPARELARPRNDLAQQRQTADDAAQHLVRQASEGGRGGDEYR